MRGLVCGRQAGDVTTKHPSAVTRPDFPVGSVGIDLGFIERLLWRGAAARAGSMRLSDLALCWEHAPRLACGIGLGSDCPALLASLLAALREVLAAFPVSGKC
jgi:hypothetical protein